MPTHIRSLLLVARARAREPLLQQIAFTCLHREAFCLLSRSALAYNIYVSRAEVMSSYLPLKIVSLLGNQKSTNYRSHTHTHMSSHQKHTNVRGRSTYFAINHLKISTLAAPTFPTLCVRLSAGGDKTIGEALTLSVGSFFCHKFVKITHALFVYSRTKVAYEKY